MPDHMNYYKGDMDRYFKDKAAIARFQKKGDLFHHDARNQRKNRVRVSARFREHALPSPRFRATGISHCPASITGAMPRAPWRQRKSMGIADDIIKNILKSFSGLPGRLEFLGEKNGIAFYDDGNSTTPEADDRRTPRARAARPPDRPHRWRQ